MKAEEKFINFVKSECEAHGVQFKPYKRSYIKMTDSIKCSGFFDDGSSNEKGKPILAFAHGNPEYLGVLAHEYCHLTQWIDGIPLWKKSEESMGFIDLWLSGEDVSDINKHLGLARDLELDNEIRTVEIIKKWHLPIDIKSYIQAANAYVMFYNYLKISRRWCIPPNTPYRNPRVRGAMSTEFDMDYKKLSKNLENIFREENI